MSCLLFIFLCLYLLLDLQQFCLDSCKINMEYELFLKTSKKSGWPNWCFSTVKKINLFSWRVNWALLTEHDLEDCPPREPTITRRYAFSLPFRGGSKVPPQFHLPKDSRYISISRPMITICSWFIGKEAYFCHSFPKLSYNISSSYSGMSTFSLIVPNIN